MELYSYKDITMYLYKFPLNRKENHPKARVFHGN